MVLVFCFFLFYFILENIFLRARACLEKLFKPDIPKYFDEALP